MFECTRETGEARLAQLEPVEAREQSYETTGG